MDLFTTTTADVDEAPVDDPATDVFVVFAMSTEDKFAPPALVFLGVASPNLVTFEGLPGVERFRFLLACNR